MNNNTNVNNNIIENIYDDFNIHEEKNVILLRYFYEMLVRIAYLKFNSESKLTLDKKLKLLIDTLKSYFRGKRKTSLDISINASIMIDPKLRNFDTILESSILMMSFIIASWLSINYTMNRKNDEKEIKKDFKKAITESTQVANEVKANDAKARSKQLRRDN